jgi:hypothetical protein
MADFLNKTFGDAFTREDKDDIAEPAGQHLGEELSEVFVTVKEVKEKIKKLRRDAAAGPDGIGPGLLMELKDELSPVLANIFNKNLRTGGIPKEWKEANVAPIFKKGKRTSPENYRPVSLTSVCCKLLESVIKDKIMLHLKKTQADQKKPTWISPWKELRHESLVFF